MRPLPPNPKFVIPIVAGIGNALMAVPLARQIKSAFPGAHITILARIGAMAEPFRRLPEIDQVLVTGKGLKGIARSILWARRQHADVYLVPFPSNRWQYSLLALVQRRSSSCCTVIRLGKLAPWDSSANASSPSADCTMSLKTCDCSPR